MNLYNFKWINGVKTMSIMNDLKKNIIGCQCKFDRTCRSIIKKTKQAILNAKFVKQTPQ